MARLLSHLPRKPAVLRRRPTHQGQVLGSVQGQRLVDHAAGVDVGSLRPLAGHGEDVLLPGDLLTAIPAAQNLRLEKNELT